MMKPAVGLLYSLLLATQSSNAPSQDFLARTFKFTSPSPHESQAVPPHSATKAGTVQTNSHDGQKYVWIPAGTFQMGCSEGDDQCFDNEKPAHMVTISKGFWLEQTEVTVAAYKRFAEATGRPMPPEPRFLDRPVNEGWRQELKPIVNVTWHDATAYCSWAGGQLPTEAQWEYAARAGSPAAQYGPPDRIAWFASNSGTTALDAGKMWQEDRPNYVKRLFENGNGSHDVAQKQPNDFGLYDTLGNVWEWTRDWYADDYYRQSPSRDPQGPPSGQNHALRGGSWSFSPSNLRVSIRGNNRPDNRVDNRGFRCACEVLSH